MNSTVFSIVKRLYWIRVLLGFVLLLCGNIASKAAVQTYTVGPAQAYTTILAAYNACTTAGDSYIIEVMTTYVTEALPITLTQKTNLGVMIRPQGALTISTGAAAQVFNLSGADNVTIDGRVNSSGSTPVLTIENTQNAASQNAIRFVNDATNNTVRYCLIKGSSTGLGTIYFSTATSVGNDNNTIDHCTISKSTGGVPGYSIHSGGTSTMENSGIIVSDCNIVDFSVRGISVSTHTDSWTITGNSFYQSASQTPAADMFGVYIGDGSNYTISGNFFGGQAASCGGSAFTLAASATYFTAIYFSSSITDVGVNTINGNTIKKFNVTTNGSPVNCFRAMYCAGPSAFNIGAAGSGNGNAIGDTVSGTGNILITSSGTPSSIFKGIVLEATGSPNTVRYNAMGSITCTGTTTGTAVKESHFIDLPTGTVGATTIQYNTIGNPATLANINLPDAGSVYSFVGIYCGANSNTTISNNLIQNVSALSTGDAAGSEGAEGIMVVGSGTATYTVEYNIIGNTTANNIVYGANRLMHGIWFKSSGGTHNATGNIVQNFNLTNTGSSVLYHGQCNENASALVNFVQDTVRNITTAGTGISATDPFFQGFRIKTAGGAGNTMSECCVKNMSSTTATANVFVVGIYTNAACAGSIVRCHISGNSVVSTGASAANYGMHLTAQGNWDIYNNVVLLDNGGNASPTIRGINDKAATAVTTNVYHNSVKIYGTGSNSLGACNSAAFYRESTPTDALNLKNNVLQNIRTGGTGKHYACYIGCTAACGSRAIDYNYLQTTANPIAFWNGTGDISLPITNWTTFADVGADEVTGTVSIENVWGYTSNAPVPGNGLSYGPVPQDKEFCNRSTGTKPSGPWIGAWECSPGALPVTMLNFNGRCEEGLIYLKWITATEMNNDYFSIERSTDGKNYQSIGKTFGFGNSSVLRAYEFVDNESRLDGVCFYRMKQVDYNGQYEYFGPVSVRCNSAEAEILPTVSEGVFYFVGDASNTEIVVYSLIGEKVFSESGYSVNSVIDITSQPSGVYFVRIKTLGGIKTFKVLKL